VILTNKPHSAEGIAHSVSKRIQKEFSALKILKSPRPPY
jgi:hypothetical protein